jgi:hypothetical protein
MSASSRKINFLLAIIFFVYVALCLTTNQPARSKPRELTDTTFYLSISKEPVFDIQFWGRRAFVFPLLLKITKQDTPLASSIQLGFSILAWGLLALSISASIRTVWLKPLSFGIILALSLVRHLASWNFIMLTESLSVSWFVIFLAFGIWLSHGWRIDKVIALSVAGVFLAFTRDTNAYLLLMLAGMLTLGVLFRWLKPRVLILVAFFLLTFLLLNYNSEIGGRWNFPLNNIVGRRILFNPRAVTYLASCGMPVTPELLAMKGEYANGRDKAFYNDPALEEYRTWLEEHGKSCYMKWLLTNPVQSVAQALGQFQELIAFNDVSKFFARKYDPVIPWFIEPFIYPVKFIILLWVALTAIALIAVWKRAWKINPLWGVYILLTLPILPHLFIVWHGDVMDSQRHALSVGLQLALCFWIAIFLLLDQFVSSRSKEQK